MTSRSAVESVANYHCQLGENPLWHALEARIYWEDIDSGRLFRAEHGSRSHACFYQTDVVGGFTFQANSELLLFQRDQLAALDLATGVPRVLRQNIDSEMVRFNDVIADPEGRVYAGSIGSTDRNGGLYLVERDASVRCLWKGTGISNGMAFSGDLSRFYWTCSTTRRIFVMSYDRKSGQLGDKRLFYAAPEGEGDPDGLTIDTDDHIWTTRWGGSAVLRITPDGKLVDRIELPVTRVTSATFGGPSLDTLYITTAGGDAASASEDGSLFRCVPGGGVRGRTEFTSRIGL